MIIIESNFGSLQQAAADNSTMNMTSINNAVQNLGLPSNISAALLETIKTGITQFLSYIASSAMAMVSSIPGLVAQMLILIFSIFYFARDGDKVIQYIKDVIPSGDKDFYLKVFHSADDVLKSIIVGNVIPTVILGVLSGFYITSSDIIMRFYWQFSGIAMFIPIIGPWIVFGVIGLFSILLGTPYKECW